MNNYNSQITNDKSYISRQKLHQFPLYYTVTTNKKYSQTHHKALTSLIQKRKRKKKEKKKEEEVTDHLSSGTTSHGPLGPLTNTKTPHDQHSAESTSKQAANKININPSQKANNFKSSNLKESHGQRAKERERERERERAYQWQSVQSSQARLLGSGPGRLRRQASVQGSRCEASSSGPGVRR